MRPFGALRLLQRICVRIKLRERPFLEKSGWGGVPRSSVGCRHVPRNQPQIGGMNPNQSSFEQLMLHLKSRTCLRAT